MIQYPYDFMVLQCGCREVRTGPTSSDEYSCDEHTTAEGSVALMEARHEIFGGSAQRIALARSKETAAKIENLIEAQYDGDALIGELRELQRDLIGEAALAEMQAQRFKAYQESHKWLYPKIYGVVEPPVKRNRILSNKEFLDEFFGAMIAAKRDK